MRIILVLHLSSAQNLSAMDALLNINADSCEALLTLASDGLGAQEDQHKTYGV